MDNRLQDGTTRRRPALTDPFLLVKTATNREEYALSTTVIEESALLSESITRYRKGADEKETGLCRQFCQETIGKAFNEFLLGTTTESLDFIYNRAFYQNFEKRMLLLFVQLFQ